MYWSSKDCNLSEQIGTCGINHNFFDPTNPSSIPKEGQISGVPGWAQKEEAGSQRSGSVVLSCDSLQLSLKLSIWWFKKVGEYLFPGRKCPHICKESIGGG